MTWMGRQILYTHLPTGCRLTCAGRLHLHLRRRCRKLCKGQIHCTEYTPPNLPRRYGGGGGALLPCLPIPNLRVYIRRFGPWRPSFNPCASEGSCRNDLAESSHLRYTGFEKGCKEKVLGFAFTCSISVHRDAYNTNRKPCIRGRRGKGRRRTQAGKGIGKMRDLRGGCARDNVDLIASG